MAQHSASDLYKIAAETTAKYVYFLLAASGASIAYSVEVASKSSFSLPLLLLVISLASWGVSFYAGCKNLQYEIWVNNLCFSAQQATEAMQSAQKNHMEKNVAPLRESYIQNIEKINQALDTNSSSANWYLVLQFRSFIFGIVIFVIWRAVELAINAAGK